jgi:alanine racemase
MDSIGIDVTDAPDLPSTLELLGLHQSVDTLAGNAGTIGYEILTSLDARYTRRYTG